MKENRRNVTGMERTASVRGEGGGPSVSGYKWSRLHEQEHGERKAEMLRGMAATASVLLSQKEGDVG